MTPITALLVFTPLPWLGLMVLAAYRHDLGRIVEPLRDEGGSRQWWSVCASLGLIPSSIKKPPMRPWRPLAALAASAAISVLWLYSPVPLLWYELCGIQACSAILLLLLLHNWTGPLPYRPYRDSLPYPRLGTRLRHLGGSGKQKRAVKGVPVSTTAREASAS
jgi:hypothetical protein